MEDSDFCFNACNPKLSGWEIEMFCDSCSLILKIIQRKDERFKSNVVDTHNLYLNFFSIQNLIIRMTSFLKTRPRTVN